VKLAVSAIERAERLLSAGEATQKLAERARQVRAAADVAGQDSQVCAELDRIVLDLAMFAETLRDVRSWAAAKYAAALQKYGVNLTAPAEAAARVGRSRVREKLQAALWDWSDCTAEPAQVHQLLTTLRALEPGPDTFWSRL
jgi:hypothetical protein